MLAFVLRPVLWARAVGLSAVLLAAGLGAAWWVWPNLVLPPGFWWTAAAAPAALCAGLLAQCGAVWLIPGSVAVEPRWVQFSQGQSGLRVKAADVLGLRLTVHAADRVRLRVTYRDRRGRRRTRHFGVPAGVDLHAARRLAPRPVEVRDARGRVGPTGATVRGGDPLVARGASRGASTPAMQPASARPSGCEAC